MPSVSQKQHNMMAMASTPKGRAKARGKMPPMKVAKEFMAADKGRAFPKVAPKPAAPVVHRGKKFSFK